MINRRPRTAVPLSVSSVHTAAAAAVLSVYFSAGQVLLFPVAFDGAKKRQQWQWRVVSSDRRTAALPPEHQH